MTLVPFLFAIALIFAMKELSFVLSLSLPLLLLFFFPSESILILSPSSCSLIPPSPTLPLTIRARIGTSFLIGIQESRADEPYLYDIPPTPYSGTMFRVCWRPDGTFFLIGSKAMSSDCSLSLEEGEEDDCRTSALSQAHARAHTRSHSGIDETETEIVLDLPYEVRDDSALSVWVKEIGETSMWSLPPASSLLPFSPSSPPSLNVSVSHVLLTSSSSLSSSSSPLPSSLTNGLRTKHAEMEKYLRRRKMKEEAIAAEYIPRDTSLADMKMSDVLDEDIYRALISLSSTGSSSNRRLAYSNLLQLIHPEDASGVYSFTLFRESFAERLIAEMNHIEEAYPHLIERPNSMNNYGMVIQEFGLKRLFDSLRHTLDPLFRLLFGEWIIGTSMDSQHAFTVQYTMSGDRDLDFHMDESVVTVNVNLGKEFQGGDVVFHGVRSTPSERKERVAVKQKRGRGGENKWEKEGEGEEEEGEGEGGEGEGERDGEEGERKNGRDAILHVGQTWHSADRILSGERDNLIVWWRSFASLQSPAEKFVCECSSEVEGKDKGEREGCVLPKVREGDGEN